MAMVPAGQAEAFSTRFLISVVDGWISWSRQALQARLAGKICGRDLRARFAGESAQGYTSKMHALYDLTPNGI